jgi:uncharacterized protein (TIGR00661 family)
MRALAVLPELAKRHELLILAGGDAYDALRSEYAVTRISTFKYHYDKSGKLSNRLSFKRNISAVLDLKLKGPALEMVADAMMDFGADVVVSDSEAFTHRAARRLGIPRISFDHFGLLVYCRPAMSWMDRLVCWGNARVYRELFREPERAIVSSFFEAPPRREGVCVVGAVIRKEVRQMQPSRGEHLLVYVSKGENEYTPEIERALLELDCPVRVYGGPAEGHRGNIEFKPIRNLAFIEDLASCRAVFATTGNQLLGEVIHFGKPMLGMPIDCLEQRLNAAQIERMGIGMQVSRKRVTAELLRSFLAREGEFAKNARREARNGEREAVEAIERFSAELVSEGAGAKPVAGT